ncbi:MAG: hypothetical protein KKF50_02435 [Nanoarchaeota archaeon]|nr:hypothetical protein [Nanoarchaeota archaeon]
MKKLFSLVLVNMILLICIGLLGMGSVANATPIPLDVNDTFTAIGEFDSNHDGLERVFTYEVTNNNLQIYEGVMAITISAGSNQGVYGTITPVGWNVEIKPDETCFEVITPFDYSLVLPIIFPTQTKTFQLFVDDEYSAISEEYLGSRSILNDELPLGKKVSVSSIPEPATIGLLSLGTLALRYKMK